MSEPTPASTSAEKRKRDRERMRRWRQENPELDRQRTRRYAEANKDRVTARRKVRGRPLGEVFADWSRSQVEERFWGKVDKSGPVSTHCPELGPCYVWTGDHTSRGYGLLRKAGAHRVAIWLETGEEPGAREVLHACDNPPCVRASHLRFGSHQDNMTEMAERQRAARPIKLADDKVAELRERYMAGETTRALAGDYGISGAQANRLVMGGTRKLEPVETEWRARGLLRPDQKLTPEDREQIKRRFAVGERNRALASEFGVSSGYVSEIVNDRKRVRRKANPKVRPTAALTPEDVREVRRLAASGVRRGEIAVRFGVHPGTISRLLAGTSYKDVA